MNRVWLFLICMVGLVVSVACGTGGGGGGVDCPDGLEPHRASQRFHGWTFDLPPGVECLGDATACVNAINHDEAGQALCGEWYIGMPGYQHGLCTADGWVTLWWDGNPSWVCVAYHEETPCCE